MRILGIETSCDETSAAVVEETGNAAAPWVMRSNVVASQVAIHSEWGGVVPELASRQHLRDICGVVDRALIEAGSTWRDLGAIAVTQGPGLVGSLLVGVSFAKAAAAAADLPLVAVHHLAGHIESLVLQNGELPLPAIVLVVSGGHTSLYLVERPGSYQLLSRTRDDAAGEAYDKVAKLLGLGYPGTIIDRLAKNGNDRAIALPITRLTHADWNVPELKGDLDFSRGSRPPCCARSRARGGYPPDQETRISPQLPARRRQRADRAAVRRGAALRREERRCRRRRLREQPAARRPEGTRRAARDPDVPPEPGALDRQRRHDCGCRPTEIPRRTHGLVRTERRCRAGPVIHQLTNSPTLTKCSFTPITSGSTPRSGRSSSASPTK
jgi:glycoprotease/Kae1 family metallohydrolase